MHPGEAISLLLHDLKQLLGQAMPKLEANAQEQLQLHQFLAGLPESVSSQLQATGETKSLEDIMERSYLPHTTVITLISCGLTVEGGVCCPMQVPRTCFPAGNPLPRVQADHTPSRVVCLGFRAVSAGWDSCIAGVPAARTQSKVP